QVRAEDQPDPVPRLGPDRRVALLQERHHIGHTGHVATVPARQAPSVSSARCHGKSSMWFSTVPGECSGTTSSPNSTATPHPRSRPMLSRNAGCAAIAVLVYGTATIGSPRPCPSTSSPSASVSQIPCDHLLIVFTEAGATIIASGSGSTSGSPGFLNALRTWCPVCTASAESSTNLRPAGVATTQTSHPSACARP